MIEIKVPELAESITEGTIAQWLKEVGEYVNQGDFIAELETDKVNLEITAEHSGVIKELKKEPGDTVEVGEVIAVIDDNGSESGDSSNTGAEEPKAEAKQEEKSEPKGEQKEEDSTSEGGRPLASPAARKLAREKGINLNDVSTNDPTGRVRKQDVENHQPKKAEKSAPAPQKSVAPAATTSDDGKPAERIKMTRRRQTIAKRLVEAQQTAAMLTTFNEVDMTAVMDVRKRRKDAFLDKNGVKLGFMSFFTKAVIGALKEFPLLNAEIQGDEILMKKFYDIGIAVSTDNGLVVPVVRDADKLSFAGIEKEIGELGKKARDNKLALGDLQGGSFTITNGGTFGSLMSTPILNAPQVGILGMHKIQWRPVAIDQENFENRPMMYIALSYDHRIVDGKEAVGFLVRVKELLEDPESLLLEG
ncbi:dihydrolipoamide succinyltransferase [Alkalihalobacillus alcalophilus ATCC 27647 = CGMCC 1.3604]|uniref:Dihydrolipoyllysine-residue succinyltransferase component of 2-oxoglutarate dehydrogenase complex n=1 Tax=Alkalihalobacillus alcalophilus ATCC 27647 = CGMCC 1.3604 TaxID=1218173 RepID=A0A094YYZ0_ALKAL|nr:2-oxoglutarate dehydrogenase complex dihydrolipoyllysine-residue succinyltransferase [Alkalihalobacillus alcalophilus]KGA98732.1 dihydrolipoamide succinyltransferase [Alkalihalobacillus alcalophilus ATCC 27647 = CGMCC 1.3604]MED1562345.1 2-oxoglutarate dehydrogenase complex dihydrolipoyllysine-residue succinyltransferase [Alkalihalobacillus alcalophilus]THG89427.1 dihydrolipoamide succinyltransferase [Alkalihalobacillus alcalophilus ATCC 27647 = CGMCC 1.3604]